jgi:hypothetical protein
MVVVVVVTKRVEKPGDKVSRVAWTGQSCGTCGILVDDEKPGHLEVVAGGVEISISL